MSIAIVTPLYVADRYRKRNWLTVYAETAAQCQRHGLEWIVAEARFNYAANLEHCRRVECTYFTRAIARNIAARETDAKTIIFLDADVIMSDAAWDRMIELAPRFDVYSPGVRWGRLGPRQTANRIGTDHRFDWSHLPPIRRRRMNRFAAICAASRHFLETVGGWDERFQGWGYEDAAMVRLANNGPFSRRNETDMPLHLYHTNAQKRNRAATRRLFLREYAGRSYADILARKLSATNSL